MLVSYNVLIPPDRIATVSIDNQCMSKLGQIVRMDALIFTGKNNHQCKIDPFTISLPVALPRFSCSCCLDSQLTNVLTQTLGGVLRPILVSAREFLLFVLLLLFSSKANTDLKQFALELRANQYIDTNVFLYHAWDYNVIQC